MRADTQTDSIYTKSSLQKQEIDIQSASESTSPMSIFNDTIQASDSIVMTRMLVDEKNRLL